MPIHIGVSMYSYVRAVQAGKLDIPSFIHEAARIGAEGVELLDFFYQNPESDRQAALQALAETGLDCGVFSVANNFAKTSPEERDQALQRIKTGVDEALHFQAKTVRVFAGNLLPDNSLDPKTAHAYIVDGLAQAADYAQAKSIRLALENHGKLAGRSDQVRQIITEVRAKAGHAALGANPDTGNFLLVNQPGHQGVADIADLAYMVHFKDFAPYHQPHPTPAETPKPTLYEALDGSLFVGVTIGQGTVDLAACVQALRQARFDGWLNLEYEGEEDPFQAVPLSLANTRQYLA